MQEPKRMSVNEALDHFLEKAQMCALELADQAGKPYLVHTSAQFQHPITDQLKSSMICAYAGPHAAALERVVAKAAQDFLTLQGKVN